MMLNSEVLSHPITTLHERDDPKLQSIAPLNISTAPIRKHSEMHPKALIKSFLEVMPALLIPPTHTGTNPKIAHNTPFQTTRMDPAP